MIPLNDSEPNRYIRLPVMTISLIVTNALITLLVFNAIARPVDFVALVNRFGTVPYLILNRQGGGALSTLTSMFLHSGVLHLFGNMLALWVYGRRVEDMCGHGRFLLFYLTCGVIADLAHIVTQSGSNTPTIGASGAVFGVMGAHLILFPKGRIRTLVILGVVPVFPRIRALWLILLFFLLELPPAFDILFNQTDYHIGHWAHLGGFFASLSVLFFLRPEAFHRYRNEMPL
jgi:membrane associated rhomboid family serine protease